MANITVAPRFFEIAKREYNDWKFAFVREIIQNALDSGADRIITKVTWSSADQTLRILVDDNGCGMNEDVLTNKLLSLGGSGKPTDGTTTGGFGKAKELLFFCQQNYTVVTSTGTETLCAAGEGGSYELTRVNEGTHKKGTCAVVYMPAHYRSDTEEWVELFQEYIAQCAYDGVFYVNGSTVRTRTPKNEGEHLRTFDCGNIYKIKNHKKQLLIRINGVLMFKKSHRAKEGLVLELSLPSLDCLSASRDTLRYPFSGEVDDLVEELSTETESATEKKMPRCIHYKPSVLEAVVGKVNQLLEQAQQPQVVMTGPIHAYLSQAAAGLQTVPGTEDLRKQLQELIQVYGVTEFEFKVKDDLKTDRTKTWYPENWTADKTKKAPAIMWQIAVREVLAVLNRRSQQYCTGYIFAKKRLAEYESELDEDSHFSYTFLLNPVGIRVSNKGAGEVLSYALHEVAHHCSCGGWHDETFAAKLSDITAKVLPFAAKIQADMLREGQKCISE